MERGVLFLALFFILIFSNFQTKAKESKKKLQHEAALKITESNTVSPTLDDKDDEDYFNNNDYAADNKDDDKAKKDEGTESSKASYTENKEEDDDYFNRDDYQAKDKDEDDNEKERTNIDEDTGDESRFFFGKKKVRTEEGKII
ncbi:hypothetical protein XENTR_v10005004 [Xenopus tropicalis]|nr:hypothetical protein XENTR_v10005004 [Xenopus tropicalis]